MGFLSKAFGKLQNASGNYGWLTGGQNNYAEGRVGDFLNNITGSSSMLNKEYANNVALWNMQNEYNTPAAQIARMKAAGIDVNPLTYAVGNGSMSTAAGSVSAPSVGASGVNPVSTLMSVLSGIESVKSQRIANELAEKDLEFYERHGYGPHSSEVASLGAMLDFLAGKFKGWWSSWRLFPNNSHVRTPDEAVPEDKLVVRDKRKPYFGSNVVRDTRTRKDIKFFPFGN